MIALKVQVQQMGAYGGRENTPRVLTSFCFMIISNGDDINAAAART
jgi:hypothetical protein